MKAALEAALGTEILRETPLTGGCINHAAKLETKRGTFFAKWSEGGTFAVEAVCLREMRGTSLVIPEVIAVSDDPPFLITEFLEAGPRAKEFDDRLGRGLAELHRKSADRFGFPVDTYCGSTRQPKRLG